MAKQRKRLDFDPGEKLLSIAEAVETVIGRRVHPTTAVRWTLHGVRGVKLASAVVGGRPRTTTRAVREFIEETTASEESAA